MPRQLTRGGAEKLIETYLAMAELGYRPGAPSDGMGTITEDETPSDLTPEALKWARHFHAGDEAMTHWVGCTDFATKGIVAELIEVVRILNGGSPGRHCALRLLLHATTELMAVIGPPAMETALSHDPHRRRPPTIRAAAAHAAQLLDDLEELPDDELAAHITRARTLLESAVAGIDPDAKP